MIKKKKRTIIKVDTIDEAKKQVLKLVKQGVAFREIAKITFQIGDRQMHFNISQISKIKNGTNTKENDSKNIDRDTMLLINEFDTGKHPKDVVKETGLNIDFVVMQYHKYLNLIGARLVEEDFFYKIHDMLRRLRDAIGGEFEDYVYLEKAVNYYLQKRFTLPCCRCGNAMDLDQKMWADARKYLISERWYCDDCESKNARL